MISPITGLSAYNLIQNLFQYGNTLTELKTMVNSSKKIHHTNLYDTIRSTCLFLAVIAILVPLPLSVNAKIYKWVDEQGNVHYGAQKPEDAEAERIKIKEQPTFGGEDAEEEESKTEKDNAEGEKKPEKAQERLEGDAVISKKEKARLCKQAKSRLQSIQNSGRLRAYDEKGNSRILSDKERNKRLAAAKNDVKEYCR
jgi:hypothetical protein